MNEKTKLSLLLALALSLFFGHEAIINFDLSNTIYNPFYSVLPFFVLFYFIIKLELKLLDLKIKKFSLKPFILSSMLFVGVIVLVILYGLHINSIGLGNFSSYAERGNHIYVLMTVIFLASSLFFMIFAIFYTNYNLKKQRKNELKSIAIASIVLFGLNYFLTYIFVFLYNILSLLIGFATGG